MPNPRADAPLIVTALLGRESFAILDELRRRHFPAALNRVPAHLSLFHNLSGIGVDEVVDTVAAQCRGLASFDLAPLGTQFLGRGVAIRYDGGALVPLRQRLARDWSALLTPQDRQPFRPHVTIQNKVAPDVARTLMASLTTDAFPACRVDGLAIWRYLDGPWEAVADCRFRPDGAAYSGATTG